MSLIVRNFAFDDLVLGSQHACDDRVLQINERELRHEIMSADPRIKKLQIEVARPGDRTRILCVKDVVQPRNYEGSPEAPHGVVDVLTSAVVVTCGPIVGYQEGVIDMSGPGARYTPFSRKQLLILKLGVTDPTSKQGHEEVVRRAGLSAASSVARLLCHAEADETIELNWKQLPPDSPLPKIAYVYAVLSQGLLHDTYIFGRCADEGLPQIVDPRSGMTGAIVSGNCVSACDKNTTYFHQNNPVISELLKWHGIKWNLVGVVITNEPTRLAEKRQSAQAAVELVTRLKAEGAIVTKEGFGNPDADQMMLIRGLETAGVRTVTITDEFAGSDGCSQSLADTTNQADAVVSVGNANQQVVLPAMNRVVGDLPDVRRLSGGYPYSLRQDGSLEVELQAIVGATNQLGYGKLSCREV